MKREEFIKTFFRLGILALFGIMVGRFAKKEKLVLTSDCTENLQCQSCGKITKCSLPEADKFKKDGKR